MCQPKPGLRCAGHLRPLLVRAVQDVKGQDPGTEAHFESMMKVISLSNEFDATPRGQRLLMDNIQKEEEGTPEMESLRNRLDAGRRRRENAAEALADVRGELEATDQGMITDFSDHLERAASNLRDRQDRNLGHPTERERLEAKERAVSEASEIFERTTDAKSPAGGGFTRGLVAVQEYAENEILAEKHLSPADSTPFTQGRKQGLKLVLDYVRAEMPVARALAGSALPAALKTTASTPAPAVPPQSPPAATAVVTPPAERSSSSYSGKSGKR